MEQKDYTGKIKKIINFYIDKEVIEKFREFCRKKQLHAPSVIEGLIREFIKE